MTNLPSRLLLLRNGGPIKFVPTAQKQKANCRLIGRGKKMLLSWFDEGKVHQRGIVCQNGWKMPRFWGWLVGQTPLHTQSVFQEGELRGIYPEYTYLFAA
jgi:hypothetical protein